MRIQPSMDLPTPPGVDAVMQGVQAAVSSAALVGFVAIGYTLIVLDRRRDASPARDDTQVGLKLALWGVILAGVLTAAGGCEDLLAFVLGGFKGGWKAMRGPLATIVAGALPVAAVWKLMLPRTNGAEKPYVERLALGAIAVLASAATLIGLQGFLTDLLAASPWAQIAAGLSQAGVWGGLAVLAASRLGLMSGWRAMPPRMPVAPMAPPMAPPGGAGMPPLGGGYPPPQGGGYPPQGGGYPPQGGGYPPQGGGWPGQ